ncbi:MAG TPA: hypothetical protein VG100_13800 [Xanthobacteraceae bacterium]|nr:hypothetical protein [Xanthobacteraceae bacterium]
MVIVVFLGLLFFAPKGVWRTAKKLGKNIAEREKVREKSANARASEIKILQQILMNQSSNDPFAYTKEKLFRAIDYAIRRHDWYEDQRSRVFQQTMTISFAILTISLTVTGLVVQKSLNSQYSDIFACLFGFIVLSVISITWSAWLYNSELDKDRPYRSVSDIRFWYYRYNLPAHSTWISGGESLLSQAQAVLEERKTFFDRISENLKVGESMREDLEQLFILQVLQRYKSESLSQLRWLLSYLALFTGIEVIITYWVLVRNFL